MVLRKSERTHQEVSRTNVSLTRSPPSSHMWPPLGLTGPSLLPARTERKWSPATHLFTHTLTLMCTQTHRHTHRFTLVPTRHTLLAHTHAHSVTHPHRHTHAHAHLPTLTDTHIHTLKAPPRLPCGCPHLYFLPAPMRTTSTWVSSAMSSSMSWAAPRPQPWGHLAVALSAIVEQHRLGRAGSRDRGGGPSGLPVCRPSDQVPCRPLPHSGPSRTSR